MAEWLYDRDRPFYAARTSNQGLVTVDASGSIRLWETTLTNSETSLGGFKNMIGAVEKTLQITKKRYSGLDVNNPKYGKIDVNNVSHVGGNTWAGGTGGKSTF